METLYKKLYDAYQDGDLTRMEKYLKRGVPPSYSDDALFTMSACSGDYDALKLLLSYDKEDRVNKNREIMGLACVFCHYDCVDLLSKYVDIEKFKYTTAYETIKNHQHPVSPTYISVH